MRVRRIRQKPCSHVAGRMFVTAGRALRRHVALRVLIDEPAFKTSGISRGRVRDDRLGGLRSHGAQGMRCRRSVAPLETAACCRLGTPAPELPITCITLPPTEAGMNGAV